MRLRWTRVRECTRSITLHVLSIACRRLSVEREALLVYTGDLHIGVTGLTATQGEHDLLRMSALVHSSGVVRGAVRAVRAAAPCFATSALLAVEGCREACTLFFCPNESAASKTPSMSSSLRCVLKSRNSYNGDMDMDVRRLRAGRITPKPTVV